MKRVYLMITGIVLLFSVSAQNITGKWYGTFSNIDIIFILSEENGNYSTVVDIPKQGVKGHQANRTTYKDNELVIEISQMGFIYKGELQPNEVIEGKFTQHGSTHRMPLSRSLQISRRPQTPVPPFPYSSEEIFFTNHKENIRLAGTLTMPKGKSKKAVVLVSGSGPQNRDEELFDHKPFAVLADYLTRKGVTVLRFDDRGVGKSEGIYNLAGINEFVNDTEAAIDYLRNRTDLSLEDIGIIGHSLGGAVALVLAAEKIPEFIITLAGPGIRGDKLMELQRVAIFRGYGKSDQEIQHYNQVMQKAWDKFQENPQNENLLEEFKVIMKGSPLEGQEKICYQSFSSPEMNSFLLFDPDIYFPKITCPVLSLNGEKDVQVIGKANLDNIKQGITANGNKQVTTILYPDLNHLFQTANTGQIAEYSQIEETMNHKVLEDIASWINKLTIKK